MENFKSSFENNREFEEKRFWEKHYKHYDFFQNKLEWYNDTMDFHIENMKNCKFVLDTGAGSGNLTIKLANNDRKILAIDSEPYALKLLQEKANKDQKHTITVIEGDVQETPFLDKEFDGITSMFLVPFIEDNEQYFNEVYRVLKSGGILSASIWAPIQHVETDESLKTSIENKFKESGVLPKYQQEWDEFLSTSKVNAKNIDSTNLTDIKIKEILSKIGFVDISFYQDIAYNQYAYFLSAKRS